MGQLDLNAAAIFVRVVGAGGFRAAARELGVPKTTVSRKVAELEAHLGAQLLQRTTRTLVLTDAGAAFAQEASQAISLLQTAEQSVSALHLAPSGAVRITATPEMGRTLLAPLLAEFLRLYPAVEVVLHLTSRHVDLVAERVDVALRVGPLPDSSLVAQRVGSSVLRLVASPEYLQAQGTPLVPADLSQHKCLRFVRTGDALRQTWTLGRGRRAQKVAVAGPLVADDLQVLREAACGGLGMAQLPAPTVQEALATGQLVSVLDDWQPPETTLFLVHAGGRFVPSRVKALVAFLAPRLSALLDGAGRGED